jgi:folate-dependent phosphoribosylglycinamide formyltransferase PurN
MASSGREQGRPIGVVIFGGGPRLEHGAKQFICRLAAHPEIDLLAAFCQSQGQGLRDVTSDLWRRRHMLALPLLLVHLAGRVKRALFRPAAEEALDRAMAQVAERIHFVPDIHAVDVLDRVRALAPDLGLVYGSPVLKPELFEIPRLGTLGIHHGKMPEYRGKKTTFWAMYNGEATAGVTIQRISAGLDAGVIVKQGEVPIGRRSYGAVSRQLETLGLDLYMEALLEAGESARSDQQAAGVKGRLYRDPSFVDFIVFWGRQWSRRLRRIREKRRGPAAPFEASGECG